MKAKNYKSEPNTIPADSKSASTAPTPSLTDNPSLEAKRKADRDASVTAVRRAMGHLKDYAQHLTNEGFHQMAKEVTNTAEALSNPIFQLGGAMAYRVEFNPETGEAKWKQA